MTADFNDFGEAFKQFQDMMGGGPPGAKKTPSWVKYLEVKAGDTLRTIIPTAFQMHAAVTGKTLHFDVFLAEELDEKKVREIMDDITSKIPCIFVNMVNDSCLLNDDTFIIASTSNRWVKLEVNTFDENILTYIKNVIDFQKE